MGVKVPIGATRATAGGHAATRSAALLPASPATSRCSTCLACPPNRQTASAARSIALSSICASECSSAARPATVVMDGFHEASVLHQPGNGGPARQPRPSGVARNWCSGLGRGIHCACKVGLAVGVQAPAQPPTPAVAGARCRHGRRLQRLERSAGEGAPSSRYTRSLKSTGKVQ